MLQHFIHVCVFAFNILGIVCYSVLEKESQGHLCFMQLCSSSEAGNATE